MQAGFSKFSGLFNRVGSISRVSTFNFVCTKEEPITDKPMDFTPEDEDKVIREVVSYKLDRHIVNPSKNVWRESTQTKAPSSPLQIGDSLRYTNEVKNEMVEILDVNKNNPDSIKYIIKLLRKNKMVVTNDLIK